MRLLAVAALSLMFVSFSNGNWDGTVMVDPNGVHHIKKGSKPSGWFYPERGYVLGIPIRYSQLSKQALEDIPGVGPSLATKLMNLRKNKPQATWGDVDAVSGVGPKKLKILKKAISLSD